MSERILSTQGLEEGSFGLAGGCRSLRCTRNAKRRAVMGRVAPIALRRSDVGHSTLYDKKKIMVHIS